MRLFRPVIPSHTDCSLPLACHSTCDPKLLDSLLHCVFSFTRSPALRGIKEAGQFGGSMRICFCVFLCGASLAFLANAQTVDTAILGVISDSGGGAVSGATVNIIQPATGLRHSTKTAANGSYEVRYLVPGQYVLEVQMQGFRTARKTGLIFRSANRQRSIFRCRWEKCNKP